MMKLKELKKGDWFTLRDIHEPKESQVWIRDEYDRTERKYICVCFGDICRSRLIKGDKEVYTGFTF